MERRFALLFLHNFLLTRIFLRYFFLIRLILAIDVDYVHFGSCGLLLIKDDIVSHQQHHELTNDKGIPSFVTLNKHNVPPTGTQ